MNWNTLKQLFQRINVNKVANAFINSTPVTKIASINIVMYIIWKLKIIPQTFLVKNFSFEHYNINQGRYHTIITYAFSHTHFFHLLLQLVIMASFGRVIRIQFGDKIVWWAYLLGSLGGGVAMNYFMPQHPYYVFPQVGCQAGTSSLITFLALQNIRSQVILFRSPVPVWSLLTFFVLFSLLQPSKKSIGGIIGGLFTYRLFKFKFI